MKNFSFKSDGPVKIEPCKPYQEALGITTPIAWINSQNIEEGIKAVDKLNIRHIHVQTKNINFLFDPRLKELKGINLQFPVENWEPLWNHPELTHLNLPDNINDEFDFSNFPNVIYLACQVPKRYRHFDALKNLKYAYLSGYRKKDFHDFSDLSELQRLQVHTLYSKTLEGLAGARNLEMLTLNSGFRLLSLKGIGSLNKKLKYFRLSTCKRLKDLSPLGEVTNLQELSLYRIPQIESLTFLNKLHKLDRISLNPDNVRVINNDFYPLVDLLKKQNKLGQLSDWNRLQDYLDKKVKINPSKPGSPTDWQILAENLPFRNWVGKLEFGLYQYTEENCVAAEAMMLMLIQKLERNPDMGLSEKIELIKKCVIGFNQLNEALDGRFIETGEREELCSIFDDIADSAGIDLLDHGLDFAGKWRQW